MSAITLTNIGDQEQAALARQRAACREATLAGRHERLEAARRREEMLFDHADRFTHQLAAAARRLRLGVQQQKGHQV